LFIETAGGLRGLGLLGEVQELNKKNTPMSGKVAFSREVIGAFSLFTTIFFRDVR
jgi:hypothetical protein